MAMPTLKQIIGSITGKLAFERTQENFTIIKDAHNALETNLTTHEAENATQGLLGHIKLPEANKNIIYQNGWSATLASSYYKDEFGIVHLWGSAYGGIATIGTVIFTLPLGYRPSAPLYAIGSVFGEITDVVPIVFYIDTDGTVKFNTSAKYNIIFNLSFRV